MSGNSPLWRGYDTGYASWRTIQLRRWTTSGCPPRFTDAADYDRRLRQLLGIGGTADLALISWNVRLSEHLPTIEFRMADAQLTSDDTLLIAALCRALVMRAVEDVDAGGTADAPRDAVTASLAVDLPPELLSAAIVHSAHTGLGTDAFDPATGTLAPAADVVHRLLDHVEEQLASTGDREFVHDLVERLLRDGTGAARQRAAWQKNGIAGLRRLYAATIASPPYVRRSEPTAIDGPPSAAASASTPA
jgi:carboxylate-amine ligase